MQGIPAEDLWRRTASADLSLPPQGAAKRAALGPELVARAPDADAANAGDAANAASSTDEESSNEDYGNEEYGNGNHGNDNHGNGNLGNALLEPSRHALSAAVAAPELPLAIDDGVRQHGEAQPDPAPARPPYEGPLRPTPTAEEEAADGVPPPISVKATAGRSQGLPPHVAPHRIAPPIWRVAALPTVNASLLRDREREAYEQAACLTTPLAGGSFLPIVVGAACERERTIPAFLIMAPDLHISLVSPPPPRRPLPWRRAPGVLLLTRRPPTPLAVGGAPRVPFKVHPCSARSAPRVVVRCTPRRAALPPGCQARNGHT